MSQFLRAENTLSKSLTIDLKWKVFTLIFQILCISVTLSLAILCFLEFLRNEDSVEVSYKKLYDMDENLYPSLTMCLTSPFDDKKLLKYQENLNSTSYEKYVFGHDMDNDVLSKINYEILASS